ncbi:MAG: hypothetical protein M3454_01195 [Actinomycetota bacterium]|nr:hypothetical protein [Actinomycetota bacterium]
MLELPSAGLLIAGWRAALPAEASGAVSAGVCGECGPARRHATGCALHPFDRLRAGA